MSHTTSPTGLSYQLTHDPVRLTAHIQATVTLTVVNPTTVPLPIPELTLIFPKPEHTLSENAPTSPGPLTIQAPEGWTTRTHVGTDYVFTPPNTKDSRPPLLPPGQFLTLDITNYPTGQAGATTLHITETAHRDQMETDSPHPIPLTLITWPPEPIVNPPTLNKYRYNNSETATLEWEYSPADGIDYTLSYYPQPAGSEEAEITLNYQQIRDHSGPLMSNGLRHAVYTTIPLTNDPVAFILTATYEGDTRTYTTIATVNEPNALFETLHVSGQATLFGTAQTISPNQTWTAITEGFLVCWTAETVKGDNNKIPLTVNGESRTLKYGDSSNSLTLPLGEHSSVFYTTDGLSDAEYSVTWIPLGHSPSQ